MLRCLIYLCVCLCLKSTIHKSEFISEADELILSASQLNVDDTIKKHRIRRAVLFGPFARMNEPIFVDHASGLIRNRIPDDGSR